jgi:hypothetical protein
MTDADRRESSPTGGRIPFLLGESKLILPPTANDQWAQSGIHSITGRLWGRESARQWAFLLLFWPARASPFGGADLQTLAFFDLNDGEYGTSTESRRRRKLRHGQPGPSLTSQGQFALSFQGSQGESTWHSDDGGEGKLVAPTSALHAVAVDTAFRVMRLDLEIDARKPLLPLGGDHQRSAKTSVGPQGARGSFQSGIRFSGKFEWGEEQEEVDGDGGWIAHRSASRVLRAHRGLHEDRYSHEWRQIQLADGTEISVWMYFDRRRANRVIPPTVATAIGPNGEVASTTEFHLERRSFARDLQRKYFSDGYRLYVPSWSLDLVSEPLVAAPAHELPIVYWNGPTRLAGTLDGVPVSGFGFDERTHALFRDFELVDVLRETLRRLPATALAASDLDAGALADRAWEIDGFLAGDDPQKAIRHLNSAVRPAVDALAEPHRSHILAIVDDTAEALLRWWVRP